MSQRSLQRRLIVGVDGSSHSQTALRWAAREASLRKVPLTLVHVQPIGLLRWGYGYATEPLVQDLPKLQEEEGAVR